MQTMKRNKSAAHRALEMIRHHDGLIRTRDALAMGIHPRTLYTLRDEGALEQELWVQPSADLDHLEYVTVLLYDPDADGGDPVEEGDGAAGSEGAEPADDSGLGG